MNTTVKTTATRFAAIAAAASPAAATVGDSPRRRSRRSPGAGGPGAVNVTARNLAGTSSPGRPALPVVAARRTLAIVAAAFALGTPSAASAQTPGDEQYTDPFGGDTPRARDRRRVAASPSRITRGRGTARGWPAGHRPPRRLDLASAPATSAAAAPPRRRRLRRLPVTGPDAGVHRRRRGDPRRGRRRPEAVVSERARRRR